MNRGLTLLTFLAFGACAASTKFQFTPIDARASALSPRSGHKVELFLTKRPERPYDEVGLIEGSVDSEVGNAGAARRLIEYAATKGCEGVVLMGIGNKVEDRSMWGNDEALKVIHASCIVYKSAGAGGEEE